MDDSGNEFSFKEESPGKYVASIDDALLNYDTQYKLVFSIPSGENYESGYQTLIKTAPIDSIYCLREFHSALEYNESDIEGLQFYVDLNAPDDATKYYKWQINETWEMHAGYKIYGVYDGKTVRLNNWPSDSLYYCSKTKLRSVFTPHRQLIYRITF